MTMMQRLAALFLMAMATTATAAPPMVVRPCKVKGVEEILRCGELLVPENPAQPDGRHIKLHFVVLPAVTLDPKRAPLFDLAGGPGIAATGAASFYATEATSYRQHRDVVLVDQRGTGESSPLRCPELELTSSLDRMYRPEAVRRCRNVLARHADLSQYTTANTVADLEAVRKALGYEQVDLFGLSYGTRLALAYVDLHPQRVRSAVLMGVVPADAKLPLWHARNAQNTLEQVFADCEEAAACRGSYPRLREQWSRVLQHPDFDGPSREALRTMLGSTASQRELPKWIQSMSGDDLKAFRERFEKGDSAQFAGGLYLSIVCAEDTQAITPDELREAIAGTFLGAYRADEQVGACREWNIPSLALTYGTRRREVPILIIAGDRDAVTPVEWGQRIAAVFPRSRIIVIPKLAHTPEGLNGVECLDSMIGRFYALGSAEDVDTACVVTMTAAPFAAPN